MLNFSFFVFLALLFLIGLFFWAFVKRREQFEHSYQKILESTQKQLDQQISRVNILVRAMPNLRNLLANPREEGDTWKDLALDEARALVWAEGASYWRHSEKDQMAELEITKGLELKKGEESDRTSLNQGIFGHCATRRIPVLSHDAIRNTQYSVMVAPLVVLGNLSGIFRFVRNQSDPFTQKDVDVVNMFLSHLALALENREMVINREKFYLQLVQTLADTLDSRDASSVGQSRRARELARGIARELDLPEEFIHYLEFAALMHDIGKIAIDEGVLKKPGKLTEQEYEIIKKHPEFGHKILAPVAMLAPVAPMVLYHQEWYNGKGYPEGLSGEEIPLGARIVAVLDAWGAMTSDRPWRKALPMDTCLEELKKGAGTQFDPKVVEAFIATVRSQGLLDKK